MPEMKTVFSFGTPVPRQHPLHLRQDRVVSATWAPAHRLIGHKILAGQGDFFCCNCTHLCYPFYGGS